MNDFDRHSRNTRPARAGTANWPIAELDELNLGLDPTQATIEKVKAAVAEKAAQTTQRSRRRSAAPPKTASGR